MSRRIAAAGKADWSGRGSQPARAFTTIGVLATHAIDADLFQDDDGSLYLS